MSDEFTIEVWPADSRQITQPFGVNPEVYKQFGAPGHTGIDLGGVEGATKIYTVAPGRVSRVGTAAAYATGFGNHIYIQHPSGHTTIYAHLHTLSVRQGQDVAAGEMIGLLGNTGFSTGPHLHFELRSPLGMSGWPRNITDPTPSLAPHMGFARPAAPYKEGWVADWVVIVLGDLAQAAVGGVSLRSGPGTNYERIDIVPEGGVMIVQGQQNGFFYVQVPTSTVGEPLPEPDQPAPDFPPMMATIDGWGFASYITVDSSGLRGTVGQYGINLRADPRRDAINIGIVAGGSQVTITGAQSGEYFPVKAARNDFIGEINMVEASPPKPTAGVLSGHSGVSDTTCLGWGWTDYLDLRGEKAIVGQYGINLRAEPSEFGAQMGVVKGHSVVTIAGQVEGAYTPVLVDRTDMLTVVTPTPKLQRPKPLTEATTPAEPTPTPPQSSTPGWGFTAAMTVRGTTAVAGQYGINLRAEPRRDAENLGFVPADTQVIVVGTPTGEYIPIRVAAGDLWSSVTDATTSPTETTAEAAPAVAVMTISTNPEEPIMGRARLGLHASATPDISEAEIGEFRALRPDIIKVLSFHDPKGVQQLATDHPSATWIVRAFLDFGGRDIRPEQFINDTLGDVKRTLNCLEGKDVVVELHNEPNLTLEGLACTWRDGADFNQWWLQLLGLYRQQLPGVRYIFPGLSPGGDQAGLRQEHRAFTQECLPSINASDGLGIHSYWSNPHYPMGAHVDSGVQLVDEYIRNFPNTPIWITEASNNQAQSSDDDVREYRLFWQEMLKRPTIQGVTYFVASAAPGTFEHETWVGRGIAAQLGAR